MAKGPRARLKEFLDRNYIARGSDLLSLQDHQFEELRAAVEDDEALLACCHGLDQFSVIEATVRLRKALHKEEVVIKELTRSLVRLTRWLLGMTGGLVVMTAVLIWLTLELLRHGG